VANNRSKSNGTIESILTAAVGGLALLSVLGIGFNLYSDVQRLKSSVANQQADIYQLERKVKELYMLNDAMINKMNLSAEEKQKLIKLMRAIQIDWYRHTDGGQRKSKAMVPDYMNP